MYLLIVIVILNLIAAFAHELSQPIKTFLMRPSREERQLLAEIEELKRELSKIYMFDDYTRYVKTERKKIALEEQLSARRNAKFWKNLIVNYGVGYGCQVLLGLILVGLSIFYRYTPVIVFDEKFNFAPFGGLISFPTGINGAISVPFWISVSAFTSRSISGMLQ